MTEQALTALLPVNFLPSDPMEDKEPLCCADGITKAFHGSIMGNYSPEERQATATFI